MPRVDNKYLLVAKGINRIGDNGDTELRKQLAYSVNHPFNHISYNAERSNVIKSEGQRDYSKRDYKRKNNVLIVLPKSLFFDQGRAEAVFSILENAF